LRKCKRRIETAIVRTLRSSTAAWEAIGTVRITRPDGR
jgi:hypothetical protein